MLVNPITMISEAQSPFGVVAWFESTVTDKDLAQSSGKLVVMNEDAELYVGLNVMEWI